MKINLICVLILFILGEWNAVAQNTSESSPITNGAIEDYFVKVQRGSAIYNGKEPVQYPGHITNHPYLGYVEYVDGILRYDNIDYPHILMRLDLYRNELLILSPDASFEVILQPDKLNHANFYGYQTIYFYPDGLKGCPSEGYYQRLYDGENLILRKQTASLFETRKENIQTGSFSKPVKYYIRKGDTYYTVKSKGSVLSVFKSHKKELNQYIQEQRLDFKRSPEDAIIAIVKQYELLTRKL